jgi:hypothetical protein
MAREAQTTPAAMASHFALLHSRGLLRSERRMETEFCRFGARTPELQEKLDRLLELYRQRPVTMIRMIYDRASGALRTFADAFRLRKQED